MATAASQPTVQGLLGNLENLWQGIDEFLGTLGPDDWTRPHGPDWAFADLPYHLSYFDREIIARAIELGPDIPADEQQVWSSFNDLNAWNDQRFTQRPVGQTPEQSLEQMRASRDEIRRVAGQMGDADLERPTFIPIFEGWLNAAAVLAACGAHTWNHHTELRLRLDRTSPQPSPAATHSALAFYTTLIPHVSLDRDQAANRQFTTVMEFTGPGSGAWTVRVANGSCNCSEERAGQPDLVLTQSPETFVKTLAGMQDPAAAIESGVIKVQGIENMPTYGGLFPPVDPSQVIPPMGATTL